MRRGKVPKVALDGQGEAVAVAVAVTVAVAEAVAVDVFSGVLSCSGGLAVVVSGGLGSGGVAGMVFATVFSTVTL